MSDTPSKPYPGSAEARLATLESLADIGCWEFALGQGIRFWSPGMFALFGIEDTGGPPDGALVGERLHPDDRARIARHMTNLFADGPDTPLARRLKAAGRVTIPLRLCLPGAPVRHIEVTARFGRLDGTEEPGVSSGVVRDISEERAARLRVRESEQRYAALFESDCAGHVIWQDGKPVRANAEALDLFGVDTEAALLADPGPLGARADRGAPMLQVVAEDLARGAETSVRRRWPAARADGREIWLDSRFRPIRWMGGDAIQETLFDVTKELEYAQRLRASEARYELVIEGAESGIFEWDVVRREGFISKAGLDLLGLDGDPHKGFRDLDHYLHPDDADRFLAAIRSDEPRGEMTYRFSGPGREDYRHFLATWVNAGAHKGDPNVRIGSFRDITDETNARAALDRSEQRSRIVIDNAQVGIFDWDTDRSVAAGYISPKGQKLLGFPDVADRSIADIMPLIEPGDVKRFFEAFESDAPGNAETFGFRINGEKRTFRMEWINAGPSLGEPTRRIGSFRDVTEEMRLEGERLRLEFAVRQKQKLEALGQMAGGISHEVNNMIQPILLLAKQLRTETDPEKTRAYQDDIYAAASNVRDVTRTILTFARPEPPAAEPVPFALALSRAVHLAGAAVPEGVRIDARIPDVPGDARITETALAQVILNLVRNASDAMAGEGTVTVNLVPTRLSDAAMRYGIVPGDYFRVLITDTGPGMSPAMREQVFQPFFTTKRQGEGSGLGLAIVYALISASGGAITADDGPEGGARFTLLIPHAALSDRADGTVDPGRLAVPPPGPFR